MGFKNTDGESWERGGEEDAAADTLPWVAHTTLSRDVRSRVWHYLIHVSCQPGIPHISVIFTFTFKETAFIYLFFLFVSRREKNKCFIIGEQ